MPSPRVSGARPAARTRVAVLEVPRLAATVALGLGLRARGSARGLGATGTRTRRAVGSFCVRAADEHAAHGVLLGAGHPCLVAAFDGDLPGDVVAAEGLVGRQPARGVAGRPSGGWRTRRRTAGSAGRWRTARAARSSTAARLSARRRRARRRGRCRPRSRRRGTNRIRVAVYGSASTPA